MVGGVRSCLQGWYRRPAAPFPRWRRPRSAPCRGLSPPARSAIPVPALSRAPVPRRACQINTPNSSPPSRPTTSEARTWPTSSRATALSSASPAPWPYRSLTALKPSRSTNISAACCAVALDIGERALEFAFEAAPVEDIQQRIDVGTRLQVTDACAHDGKLAFEPLDFGQKRSQWRKFVGKTLLRRGDPWFSSSRICTCQVQEYPFRLASGGPQPIIRRFLPRGTRGFGEQNGVKTGRDHHGQPVRLVHDEACRQDA